MHFSSALRLRADPFEQERFENDLSTGLSKRDSVELAAGMLPVFYPKGGMFFLEGQPATGVFLLRSGRVKESVASNRGKIAIVRIIGPGTILGLSAVLTDGAHESTVETLEPTHADFVRKGPFLRVLKTSSQLSQMVASQLSRNCKESYAAIRFLGISGSVPERLARLLLYWAECEPANHDRAAVGVRIRVTLTHEEISQFIGSTRETMSRTLGEFREKKWITVNGSTWTIINKDAIQRLAAV
ncbi:MAG: Crp/Fnr family transcriptional regulator [Acidobacteriia bacterium]|nr:Crp/Fnr family transcriptional regulator [Terriglobia bacterium]